jgi:DNA/RNA endonuclease YhcR with UshA esterase domain
MRRFLPIFVVILCTNLVGQISVMAADASLTPVAGITKSMTNHQVTVVAVISNIREPANERAPYNVSLTEGGATIPMVYWSDMKAQLEPVVKLGNTVRARVTVNLYREQLQLRVRKGDTVELVSAAPASTTASNAPSAVAQPPAPTPPVASPPAATTASSPSTPEATVIGKIKADWADRVVIISGTISGSEATDKGPRLSVQDRTGEIQVVLGEKVLAGLVVTELQPGRAISITGPVKVSDGKLTVAPEAPGDVTLAPQ